MLVNACITVSLFHLFHKQTKDSSNYIKESEVTAIRESLSEVNYFRDAENIWL